MSAESIPYKTSAWSEWEGYVVNGTFPLRQLLGVSNQGVVFLTSHSWSNSPAADAAIKLVAADSLHVEELLSQWRSVAALSHPHLVRVLDIGRCQLGEHPFVYVVMEYAEQTLAEVLVHRALTAAEVQDLLPPTLDALGFLHRNFLVHGQVKPANILVVNDQVKLASDTVRAIGQLGGGGVRASVYDPPELTDGRIGAPGDVWGLGVTLVEALTQRAPVWAGERSATPSLPAELPPAFADTVRRCLRFDRIDRPTVIELEARYNPGASARPAGAATDRRGAAPMDRPAEVPAAASAAAEPRAATPTHARSTTGTATPPGADTVEPTTAAATQSRTAAAGAPSKGSAAAPTGAPLTHSRATTTTTSTGIATTKPSATAPTQSREVAASAPPTKTAAEPTAVPPTHSRATTATASSTKAVATKPAATQSRAAAAGAPSTKNAAEPTAASPTHPRTTTVAAPPTGTSTADSTPAASTRPGAAHLDAGAPSEKSATEATTVLPADSRLVAATAQPVTGAAEPTVSAAVEPGAAKAAARKVAAAARSPRNSSAPMVIGAVLIALAVWVGLRVSQPPPAGEAASSDPSQIAARLASAPEDSVAEATSVSETPSAENLSTRPAPTDSQVASTPSSPPTGASGTVMHEVIPEVPQRVREKIRGQISVTVRVLVDPAGNVVGQFLERAGRSGYFASLARDAASDWKFAPADSRDARVWLLQFDFTHDGATAQAAPAK